jgi:hypothetical protein
MDNDRAAASPAVLLHMLAGCWVAQALYVCAKLGVADLLQEEPTPCATLAEATQTHPDALYRVLRALASVGVFSEEGDRRFRSTPAAAYLRTDVPGSLRAFAIMLGEAEHWRAWEGVLHSVRTGQSAFEHVFGAPHFAYFEEHPAAARIFDAAMTSRSAQENEAIVATFDFSGARTVVEIGGGQGTLLEAILRSHPVAQGVLFDLPHVVASSRARMWGAGLATRCEFVEGDFFAGVPTGGDLYVIKKVIHDWDDERALRILTNCRKVMTTSSRLLLIEPVVPQGNAASFSKLLDLLMLVWTSGGRERTKAEHENLLTASGFRLQRVTSTPSGVDLLEAVPV